MSVSRARRLACIGILTLAVAGCASLSPGFEPPKLRVVSLRPVDGAEMAPRFEIGMRVINPNAEALALRGLSYTVSLEGQDIIEGVASDLPTVPGYGEADVRLLATVSLLAGIRLVGDLMQRPREAVAYELRAKLDLGAMRPAVRIEDAGTLRLTPAE